MKKKTIVPILILAIFVCIFAFAACDNMGGLPSSKTPSGSISSGDNSGGSDLPSDGDTTGDPSGSNQGGSSGNNNDTSGEEEEKIDYSEAYVIEDNGTKITSVTKYGKTLSKLVIPSSVTSIGRYAFEDCSKLTSVTFGENSKLESIGSYAFQYCRSLTRIEIPSSVTSIGLDAFSNCSKLTSVTFGENSKLESIGSYAFSNCSFLTGIVIPSNVTSIGDGAFYSCPIEEAIIPTIAIDYIPKSNLKKVVITSGESIGSHAFSGCSNLESITLPFVGGSASATSASSSTLFGYIFGTSSYTGGTATNQYYDGSNYKTYYIPTSLKSVTITGGENILDKAFYNCSSLTSIEIPSSVTSIGSYTFYNCNSLTSIEIPSSVTSIGEYAFSYCSSLTSIEIPSSVTSIGNGAFKYCSSLTSIEIPSSVTSIGSYAFSSCKSLTRIEIPSSVTSIGSYAFYNCTSLTIYCEVSSKPSGWDSDWNSYKCPVVWNCKNNEIADDGNIYYVADNGIRYALKDGVATVVRQSTGLSGAVVIPSSVTYKGKTYTVTSIAEGAFSGCSNLESITLPFVGGSASATSASSSTLFGYIFGTSSYTGGTATKQYYNSSDSTTYYIPTSLRSVTITGGKNIYYGAFYNCSSLTIIEIPSSVTSIGYRAFYNCTSLTIYCEAPSKPSGWDSDWNSRGASGGKCPVVWNCKNNEVAEDGYIYFLAESGIQYGVKNGEAKVVGHSALSGDIVIPSSVTYNGNSYSVTYIGSHAFDNCSSLTSIEIPSSVTSIGSYAFYKCSSLTSIEIPSSVTSIGSYAFSSCKSLTRIEIPSSVTSIGNNAFSSCTSLTSIEIPSSVTYIGSDAFSNCSSLTSIVIPSSVTSIGSCAFYYCTSLTIYCEVESKPFLWHRVWNVSDCPVVWNYKG